MLAISCRAWQRTPNTGNTSALWPQVQNGIRKGTGDGRKILLLPLLFAVPQRSTSVRQQAMANKVYVWLLH